jgi:hypothetical protein
MNFAALSAFAEEFLALRQAVARRDPHQNGRDRRCASPKFHLGPTRAEYLNSSVIHR